MGDPTDDDTSNTFHHEGASETTLVEVYTTLREEIIQNGNSKTKRNARGVATVIVIIGYAVNFERPAVIALVPLVFSYLLIRSFESLTWTYNVAYQLSRIERELSPPGSAARYEIERGGLAGDDLDMWTRRLRNVQRWSRLVLGFLTYLGFTAVPVVVWTRIEPPVVAGIVISQQFLCGVYIVLLLIVIGGGISLFCYRRRLKAEVRRENKLELPPTKQSGGDKQNDDA